MEDSIEQYLEVYMVADVVNSSTCHIVDNGQIKFVQLVDNVLEENESICNEATGKQLEIQSNKNSHSEQSHCWVNEELSIGESCPSDQIVSTVLYEQEEEEVIDNDKQNGAHINELQLLQFDCSEAIHTSNESSHCSITLDDKQSIDSIDSCVTGASDAIVDVQSPISLCPGTIVTVDGKKCVLNVCHDTGKLVAYPIRQSFSAGKRPRGRPKKLLKQENQSGSNDSDANDLLNEGNTHAKFQLHSDQETAAAEILLGMSEVDGKRRSTRKKKTSRTLQEYEIGAIEGLEDVEEIDQDVGDNFTPTALTQPGKLSQPQPLFSSTNKLNNFLAGLGLPVKRGRGRPPRNGNPNLDLKSPQRWTKLMVTAEGEVQVISSSEAESSSFSNSPNLGAPDVYDSLSVSNSSLEGAAYLQQTAADSGINVPMLPSEVVEVTSNESVTVNPEVFLETPGMVSNVIVSCEEVPHDLIYDQINEQDLYTDGEEMNLSSQVSYCEEDYTNMSALSDNSRQLADNTNEALTNNSLELVFVDKMSALSSLPLQQTQLDVKTETTHEDPDDQCLTNALATINEDNQASTATTSTVVQVPDILLSILMSKGAAPLGVKTVEEDMTRLKCSLCCYQALFPQQYQDHLATHDNVIHCKCCPYMMITTNELIAHMKDFHPRCICEICGFMSSHAYMLTRHKMVHNPDSCKCEYCGKTYKDIYILKMHIKLVHLPAEFLFECHLCGKKFNRKAHLNRHLRTHDPVKQFSCPHCDYRGSERSDITKHIVVHSEPQHVCDICQRTFRTVQNKELHCKRHFGQRDYKCGICDYFGYTFTDIRKHIERKHASVRRYMCDTCHNVFKSEAALQSHQAKCNQYKAVDQNDAAVFLDDTNALLDSSASLESNEITHVIIDGLPGAVSLVTNESDISAVADVTSNLVDITSSDSLISSHDYVLDLNSTTLPSA